MDILEENIKSSLALSFSRFNNMEGRKSHSKGSRLVKDFAGNICQRSFIFQI
jgi:hypothetical protein